ncbi:MAG: hypothetical protein ACUVTG_15815 [Candidatus Oleimicrobiaceae bacterium]
MTASDDHLELSTLRILALGWQLRDPWAYGSPLLSQERLCGVFGDEVKGPGEAFGDAGLAAKHLEKAIIRVGFDIWIMACGDADCRHRTSHGEYLIDVVLVVG